MPLLKLRGRGNMKSEAFPPAQCSESSGHCLLCSAQQCWLLTSRREATVGSLHLSQKQRSRRYLKKLTNVHGTRSQAVTPIRSKEKPKLSTLKAYLITSWIILNFLINVFFFLNRECRLIKPENKTRNAEQGRSKCPTAETMA